MDPKIMKTLDTLRTHISREFLISAENGVSEELHFALETVDYLKYMLSKGFAVTYNSWKDLNKLATSYHKKG